MPFNLTTGQYRIIKESKNIHKNEINDLLSKKLSYMNIFQSKLY